MKKNNVSWFALTFGFLLSASITTVAQESTTDQNLTIDPAGSVAKNDSATIAPAVLESKEVLMSYEDGKNILLTKSLRVLAEYYNVSLAETEVTLAKTWANPNFVWNADMYSHELNQYFHMGNQTLVQVEYLMGLGGKRVYAIRKANIGVEIAQYAFLDVVRGLVMEYSELYSYLYILEERNKIYDQILERYSFLIDFYEKKLELNVISFNDVVRIKSEFVSIQTESFANLNEMMVIRQELNSLLNFEAGTAIKTTERSFELPDSLNVGDMIGMAMTFRPDYQIAQKNISYYDEQLKYSKAQGAPFAKIGYQPRDRGSNYVRPYTGLVFEITLPIFDRNQAGVQQAKIAVDQAHTSLEIFETEMENEVFSAYFQFLNNQKNLASYTPVFQDQLDNLAAGAMDNFQKQNITLLEFLDYQQIYLESKMQYLSIKSNYIYSIDYLGFSIGRDFTTISN